MENKRVAVDFNTAKRYLSILTERFEIVRVILEDSNCNGFSIKAENGRNGLDADYCYQTPFLHMNDAEEFTCFKLYAEARKLLCRNKYIIVSINNDVELDIIEMRQYIKFFEEKNLYCSISAEQSAEEEISAEISAEEELSAEKTGNKLSFGEQFTDDDYSIDDFDGEYLKMGKLMLKCGFGAKFTYAVMCTMESRELDISLLDETILEIWYGISEGDGELAEKCSVEECGYEYREIRTKAFNWWYGAYLGSYGNFGVRFPSNAWKKINSKFKKLRIGKWKNYPF